MINKVSKFNMKEIHLEQRKLIENGEYDSLVVVKGVYRTQLFKWQDTNKMIIWSNMNIFIYYKKELGYNEILKAIKDKEVEMKDYTIEEHLEMLGKIKHICYDKRVFKSSFLIKKEEDMLNYKNQLDKQENLIIQGNYTSRVDLNYSGNEEENSRRFLLGFNRFVVKDKMTNVYTIYMSDQVNLFINNKGWEVINRGPSNMKEQIEVFKMYKDKKYVLWKDWCTFSKQKNVVNEEVEEGKYEYKFVLDKDSDKINNL